MTSRTIVNICVGTLFVLAVLYVMGKWNSPDWQENPMYPLISIIMLAIVGGVFFVTVVLPKFGDAIGTVMYSSGEEVEQDESMKAVALVAKGDYHGAIKEYEKMIANKPEDPFPVSEIAKIYSEKLHAPDQALVIIQENLENREWTEENAAFLMFRLSDIHMATRNYDAAKDILEQVAGNFPGTRHSGNARHKINELEQLQYKEIAAQRAKLSSQG
ncbi:tetratricopeptide repeat protein [Verrucomicrobium spinosum]|uniref:tetratricopeptide repeat protein n=1 Tax=Verrucomicrobium spinosum TaxID=2736 RepID=UPI0001744706|nr:tetratricopeptide repeat protein [Verrucomicrobium spinosum]